jgi:hypothetical protein
LNDLIFASKPGILEIKRQLHDKIEELRERRAKGEEGIWMYLDSGASRSVSDTRAITNKTTPIQCERNEWIVQRWKWSKLEIPRKRYDNRQQ